MKRQFDKNISDVKFKKGDLVWMRNDNREHKLDTQRAALLPSFCLPPLPLKSLADMCRYRGHAV